MLAAWSSCVFVYWQVENLLLSAGGMVKLCDFGSATTQTHTPDHTWTPMRRSTVEDEASALTHIDT